MLNNLQLLHYVQKDRETRVKNENFVNFSGTQVVDIQSTTQNPSLKRPVPLAKRIWCYLFLFGSLNFKFNDSGFNIFFKNLNYHLKSEPLDLKFNVQIKTNVILFLQVKYQIYFRVTRAPQNLPQHNEIYTFTQKQKIKQNLYNFILRSN